MPSYAVEAPHAIGAISIAFWSELEALLQSPEHSIWTVRIASRTRMLQGSPVLDEVARSPKCVRGEVVQDVLQRLLRSVPKESIPVAAGQGGLALCAHNDALALVPALWRHACPICMTPESYFKRSSQASADWSMIC